MQKYSLELLLITSRNSEAMYHYFANQRKWQIKNQAGIVRHFNKQISSLISH